MSRNGDEQRNQVFTDAENYIKQASDMLQREAARLRQEQETIDAMSKKLEHVHFSSTIQLNVGGHRFTTSLQTLTKDPNSILAAMFSGKFEMNLLKTALSLSTEMEHTLGLYSIIFALGN